MGSKSRCGPKRGLGEVSYGCTFEEMALRLPEPMLARSGPIPGGPGWTFEPRLDGFRCLVCTHAVFRARSRRGWDMTHLLPEFRKSVPAGVQLDGELVALAEDGRPDFQLADAARPYRDRVDAVRLRRARCRRAWR
jgi:ATP-dependent DNA ligase